MHENGHVISSISINDVQGVDPSIRAEVWEFLIGCYALSSTSEYRGKLRAARRFIVFLFFFRNTMFAFYFLKRILW
jgi:hypothetical protein